jgi:hypothetical protein
MKMGFFCPLRRFKVGDGGNGGKSGKKGLQIKTKEVSRQILK